MKTEQMIEELYRVAGNHKNDVVGVGDLNIHAMCTDVAKRMQELLEKEPQSNKWIPCNERLPEEDGWYLTTVIYGSVKRTGMCRFENGVWVHCGSGFDDIAWMPLPEPYETKLEPWEEAVMKHFTRVE